MPAKKSGSTKRTANSFEEQGEVSDSSSSSSRRSSSSRSLPLNRDMLSNIDYKQILSELYTNPTVRYMAGGVAAAFLNRFANKISEKYPEISSFLRENIGTLEGKLNEFKGNMNEDRSDARQ